MSKTTDITKSIFSIKNGLFINKYPDTTIYPWVARLFSFDGGWSHYNNRSIDWERTKEIGYLGQEKEWCIIESTKQRATKLEFYSFKEKMYIRNYENQDRYLTYHSLGQVGFYRWGRTNSWTTSDVSIYAVDGGSLTLKKGEKGLYVGLKSPERGNEVFVLFEQYDYIEEQKLRQNKIIN